MSPFETIGALHKSCRIEPEDRMDIQIRSFTGISFREIIQPLPCAYCVEFCQRLAQQIRGIRRSPSGEPISTSGHFSTFHTTLQMDAINSKQPLTPNWIRIISSSISNWLCLCDLPRNSVKHLSFLNRHEFTLKHYMNRSKVI